ncbi:MAG: polysaccharide deacetylase family protein [Flavobacteriales bacterium]|nr:polysaccharide deacetylase family protein [Flavobacteriales bacterium]
MPYVERYAEIKAVEGVTLRGSVRHAALHAFSAAQRLRGATEKALRIPRVQFLYIHHTFSDELRALERLVNDLTRTHSFISYSEAVDRVRHGRIDKPYLCVSSDDGFRNNLDGARVLRDLGISACFFINPGLIGLSDETTIRRICTDRFHLPPVRFLDRAELDELAAMGHEIGSHTWEHHNMARIPHDALVEDIAKTRRTLIEWVGRADHFAFPYGRFTDFTTAGYKAVLEAGHTSCATAERGCHMNTVPIHPEHLLIRRDHIILDWPMAHVHYFLATNALRGDAIGNPYLRSA